MQISRTEDPQVNVVVYEQMEVQCGVLASRFLPSGIPAPRTITSTRNGGLVGAKCKNT